LIGKEAMEARKRRQAEREAEEAEWRQLEDDKKGLVANIKQTQAELKQDKKKQREKDKQARRAYRERDQQIEGEEKENTKRDRLGFHWFGAGASRKRQHGKDFSPVSATYDKSGQPGDDKGHEGKSEDEIDFNDEDKGKRKEAGKDTEVSQKDMEQLRILLDRIPASIKGAQPAFANIRTRADADSWLDEYAFYALEEEDQGRKRKPLRWFQTRSRFGPSPGTIQKMRQHAESHGLSKESVSRMEQELLSHDSEEKANAWLRLNGMPLLQTGGLLPIIGHPSLDPSGEGEKEKRKVDDEESPKVSQATRDGVDNLLEYFNGRAPIHKSAAKLSTEEEAKKWTASIEESIKSSRKGKVTATRDPKGPEMRTPKGWGRKMNSKTRERQIAKDDVHNTPVGPANGEGGRTDERVPLSKQTRDRIKDVLRDVGDDQRSLGGSAAELQTEEDANKWATDWERWIESRDQQWAAAAKNQQESRAETPQGWGQEMRSKSRGRQTAKEVSIKPAGPADGNGSGKDKERAMSHETRDRVDKLLKYFDGRHPYVHKSAAKLSTEEEAGKWAASMEEWIKSSRRAKSLLPETQMGQK